MSQGDHFDHFHAATSLKEAIKVSVPAIQDASQYREARKRLQALGGPAALRDELIFSGFVDPRTGCLTTELKPFNVFARAAVGLLHQNGWEEEQEALGVYKDCFFICKNREENDLCWDSSDHERVRTASMSRRHRFLCTKQLHWQYFNALVFGLVDETLGGDTMAVVVNKVESMRDAALHYARNVGDWSSNVGLYVNVFGHNNVNSLFIHIVDLSETGPAFDFQAYKNLPLDTVIKVLKEEAHMQTASCEPRRSIPQISFESCPPSPQPKSALKPRSFFFAGTCGATSLKEELIGRIPVLKDAGGYREARRLLREELGGPATLRQELVRCGFVDEDTDMLTTSPTPFNLFARLAAGAMSQPNMEEEQAALGDFGIRFQICRNRPENDEHWDSEDPEWVGKASMSRRHRFLTTRNLHWQWFNALSFGMAAGMDQDGMDVSGAIALVEAMKAAALKYTHTIGRWSKNVGLFFHVFGHNSVNSLHLHIVDLDFVGPTYAKMEHKNCPLDAVLKALKEELSGVSFNYVARAVVEAAVSIARPDSLPVGSTYRPPLVCGQLNSFRIDDAIALNVGGDHIIVVERATLELVPEGNYLWRVLQTSNCLGARDEPLFVDLPPTLFLRVIDHFRLQRHAGSRKIAPLQVPSHERRAFIEMVNILGIAHLTGVSPNLTMEISKSTAFGAVIGFLCVGFFAGFAIASKINPRRAA